MLSMPQFKSELKKDIIVLFAEVSGPSGSRFIKMLLDTGATYTTIPYEAAVAIGCDPSVSERRVEFITASGIEYAPITNVKSIKAFGFENKNFDIVCHNLPPQSSVEGLLGLNFLTQFNVFLKFLEDTLEVTK